MKKLSQRQTLFASTILCGAALMGATQANAQAAAAPAGTSQVQEVVVTGSRIPRANLESASPLTVVTAGEIKAEGVVNVENLLNNLPAVMAGQNSTVSNGSTGTATVDLRGLGPVRTLVLIDGRRLQPGDPSGGVPGPVPDLNFIPAPLVERVDVLTGGASSEYGADAVAGVVNFVMKHDFEGIQIDAQYGFDQHENGNSDASQFLAGNPFGTGLTPLSKPGDVTERNNSQVSIIIGANSPDNKGNVTAYAEYTNLQPILESSRDFSDCSLTGTTGPAGLQNSKHICAGSSNSAYGKISPNGSGNNFTWSGAPGSTTPAGLLAPFTDAARFNYGPLNYFQRSDDRYNFGAFGHYQVNDHVDVYMDTMFMDDHTVAQIAPSGFFLGPTYDIPCSNAFLTTTGGPTGLGEAGQLGCTTAGPTSTQTIASNIGLRLQGTNRQDDLRHTDYRIVFGAKGEIAEGWNYDAYVQYGASIYAEHYLNDVSIAKLQDALNTVSTTQCVTGVGCVPIDIFDGPNGVTQAAKNYVLTPGFKEGETTEEISEIDVNGDLGQYGLKSPFAKEGVKIALGADYRREELDEEVDQEFSSGDLAGQGAATPPAHGSFNIYEVYSELSVPIVSDMPFIKAFDFDGGYRYSEYSDIGQTETYKLALEYAPIADVKFRGSFNHAVRAPNVDELFQPDTVALFAGGVDPCAGAVNPATGVVAGGATLAQCMRSGVTTAQYGTINACPAAQCTELIGGNPNLRPEASDTTSFGVVFTPTFIKNFSATVDFYNIRVNNVIQGIPPTTTLDECISADVTAFCPLIHRDPADGSILGPNGYVVSTFENTGYLQTKGYDIEINYRFKLSDLGWGMVTVPEWGSVSANFVGTYTESFILEPLAGLVQSSPPVPQTYNCAGLYGPTCGNPDPHWRHKMRITWATPWNFDLSMQWRYVGGVKLDLDEGNKLLQLGGGAYYDAADEHLAGVSYFDLSGNWRVKDGLTVRAGVNNIFDRDPPLVSTLSCAAAFCNGNTYPGIYDALGRTMFVALTAKF